MTPEQREHIRQAAHKAVEGWPPLTDSVKQRLRMLIYGSTPEDPIVPASPRPRTPPEPVRTSLYRYYDADGVLLYVGVSNNPKNRDRSHLKHSAFSRFVHWHEGQWFASREEATGAERLAIRDEHPLFNGTHNDDPRRDRRLVEYLVAKNALDLLGVAPRMGAADQPQPPNRQLTPRGGI